MSDQPQSVPGHIGWLDLTVTDAPGVRDFYARVVGWTFEGHEMADGKGSWEDYVMMASDGEAIAGVCHDRGPNKGLPSVWLPYIVVADLNASLAACREAGGHVIGDPRVVPGHGRFAVIRDPAGAAMALFQSESGD